MRPPSPEKGVVASREAKPCEMERGAATLETVIVDANLGLLETLGSPVRFVAEVLNVQDEELKNFGKLDREKVLKLLEQKEEKGKLKEEEEREKRKTLKLKSEEELQKEEDLEREVFYREET